MTKKSKNPILNATLNRPGVQQVPLSSVTRLVPLTHEERANAILSGFSWTSRNKCEVSAFILAHLKEAEAETIERCVQLAVKNLTVSASLARLCDAIRAREGGWVMSDFEVAALVLLFLILIAILGP